MGLLKNLAILVRVSRKRSIDNVSHKILGDPHSGTQDRVSSICNPETDKETFLMIDGIPYGWCDGPKLHKYLLKLRRSGRLM